MSSHKHLFSHLKTTTVGPDGYTISKAELAPHELDLIKTDLTVLPKTVPGYGPEDLEPFTLYTETDTRIEIPRFYGIRQIGRPKHTNLNPGAPIRLEFKGALREYQTEILNAWDEHAEKYGGGIISVGPGRGKTVMAIAKVAQLGVKTLILVFTTDLLTQWQERIQEYTPNARIGVIRGKTLATLDKDIVIGMVQSLSNPAKDAEYPPEVFADFGMVIIDECHHIGARMFSRCLRKCSFKYTMGLSATPNRKDGLTKVFKYYLGDICFKDDSIQKTAEERVLDHMPDAHVRVYRYMHVSAKYSRELLNFQKKPNVVTMETNISKFEPRTQYILGLLPDLIAEGRKIIILTSRRDHIAEFLKAITASGVATVGPYVGGMKPEQLAESKTKQVLVATYDMAEEGFDCQELDTLIMATPKKEIEQCTGRIMRKKKNDRVRVPLIIDIADEFSSFKSWTQYRVRFYKKKNYKLMEYNVINGGGEVKTAVLKDWPWAAPSEAPAAESSKPAKAATPADQPVEYDLS